MTAVKIPYDQLSQDALTGVIEEFVTRDGTDYGEFEASLEIKFSQIFSMLKSGKAVIVFDQKTQSCTIMKSDNPLVTFL